MTPPGPQRIELPEHWTPDQALAVFEIIELLRDQLWAAYGPAIQYALREDRGDGSPVSPNALRDDPPF